VDYDVIVIGAGPAGATAAEAAARMGMKVALLEKQTLPRHKTCGGGMPMVVGEMLAGLPTEGVVEARVEQMRHTFNFEEPHLAPINPPGAARPLSLWMVQRSVFDSALAQRAARAGADLRDGISVRSIESGSAGVTVRAESGGATAFSATARVVIGADGANGVSARAAGLRPDRTLAIAIEVEHPHTWGAGHEELRPDVIHLEYGAAQRGYGWVFPKGDHLNVGAGVFRPHRTDGRGDSGVRARLQQVIWDYLTMLRVPFDRDRMRYHAHPLPLWNGREPLQSIDGRIILCGDAAGLINPIFGDGILHAIKSGQIAAETVLRGDTDGYTAAVHGHFAANFDAALKLSKFFYQFPGVCYKYGVKRDMATHTAARLLCGDALFTDVAGRAMRKIRAAMLGAARA
jgi:geranylgeranyl reductase family protein